MKGSWDLSDLVFDYYPRNLWISHTWASIFCDILPTESKKILSDCLPKDPNLVYTISPKNYTSFTNKYLAHYSEVSDFQFEVDNYGSKLNIVSRQIKPTWAHYLRNNQWYINQIRATEVAKFLFLLPGVEHIYVTGSASLEKSSNTSDIDIMIQTRPGYVWVSRFWVKFFLKLFRLDVHDIILESKINFARYLFNVKIINKTKYDHIISSAENKIWIKKIRGGLIDAGIFFENVSDLETIYPKETRNFYIWSSLKLSTPFTTLKPIQFGGDLSYWYKKYQIKDILNFVFSLFLQFLSLLLYPLLSLQYYYYRLRNENYVYFVLKKNIICYFPTVFKPKSILEYRVGD